MKKVLILLIVATTFFTACNNSTSENTSTTGNGKVTKTSQAASFSKNVETNEFKNLVEHNAGILLDVRTPQEFSAGHIEGAKNINVLDPNFESIVGKLDKSKTYLVYCRSGARSARAVGKMKALGFQKTYNLSGGFMGWQQKGFPVAK